MKVFNVKNASSAQHFINSYLNTAGGGGDMGILENCLERNDNFNNFGYNYHSPNEDYNKDKTYLAGKDRYKVKELEVYTVLFLNWYNK